MGVLLRLAALAVIGLAVGRAATMSRANTAPREMLYSDFVTLLTQRRVNSARLESGTNRLYFDVKPAEPAPAAAAAAAEGGAAAAAQPVASTVASRRLFIKLADKARTAAWSY